MSGESVLITGASSGIGLELARLFAASGSDLVLVARREDKLGELADELRTAYGVTARVLPADLAQPTAAEAITRVLDDSDFEIDVLVNNAGVGARGRFAELSLERQLQMMQLNMSALVDLTWRLLPSMLERGHGGVLNLASTAAFQPGPHMAVYYASKSFVLLFTEALAEELAATPITVSCLAPGPVATGFADQAGVDDTLLFKLGVHNAREVAWAGYRGFRRGHVLVVPGLRNKLGMMAVRLVPRRVVRKLVKRLQS